MIPITSARMLGKVLRQYRNQHNLTQSEVGMKFNLAQKTVSSIESGLPGVRLVTLFKLMSALGLEIHLEPRTKSDNDEALW